MHKTGTTFCTCVSYVTGSTKIKRNPTCEDPWLKIRRQIPVSILSGGTKNNKSAIPKKCRFIHHPSVLTAADKEAFICSVKLGKICLWGFHLNSNSHSNARKQKKEKKIVLQCVLRFWHIHNMLQYIYLFCFKSILKLLWGKKNKEKACRVIQFSSGCTLCFQVRCH